MRLMRRQRQDAALDQFNRLRDEIDRVFESTFGGLPATTGFFEGWTPAIDLFEDHEKFTVQAELPGMKKEDIQINLHGNTLNLSGERKSEDQQRQGENYRSERYFGRFQRSITLPQPVDAGRVDASYKDGLLCIRLPKTEEAKRKQIEVKAS